MKRPVLRFFTAINAMPIRPAARPLPDTSLPTRSARLQCPLTIASAIGTETNVVDHRDLPGSGAERRGMPLAPIHDIGVY